MQTKPVATVAALGLITLIAPLTAQSARMPPPPVASGIHTLRCLGPDEKTPCTREQVGQFNQMMVTGRRSYKPFAEIASFSLASPDGTLRCTQIDGALCTNAQIQAVQEYAAAKKKKGGGGCICVMKEIDMASP